MGTIINHAIIVTGDPERVMAAWRRAGDIFPQVTSIANHSTNGGCSFMVPPDGSKLGWPAHEQGLERRHQFKTWLRAECEKFGWLEWLEVRYGEVEGNPNVVAGSGLWREDLEWLPEGTTQIVTQVAPRIAPRSGLLFELLGPFLAIGTGLALWWCL